MPEEVEVTETTVYRPETTILNNSGRTVLVVGTEFISKKFLQVIDLCLTLVAGDGDHGVNSIILRDDPIPRRLMDMKAKENKTESCMADACMHAGAVTINLPETLSKSFDSVEEHGTTSIYAVWWHNMIINVLHEALHCSQLADDAKPEKWIHDFLTNKDGFVQTIEKEASTAADNIIMSMAKEWDLEPPMWGEETFFAKEALEIYVRDDAENKRVIQWLNDGVMKYAETDGEPNPITSFHDYLHYLSNDDVEDPAWGATLKPLPSASATPAAEEAAANIMTPEPATTAPATQQTAPVATPVATVADTGYDPDEAPGQDTVMDDTAGMLLAAAQVGAMDIMATGAMPSIPTTGEEVTLESLFTAPSPPARPTPGVVQQPTVTAAIQQEYAPTPNDGTTVYNPDAPVATNTVPNTGAPGAVNTMGQATQTAPAMQPLTNLNLDPAVIRERFYSVLSKIEDHIFRHCQFRSGWGPEKVGENVQGYDYADAVTKMPIQITPEEAQVVFACDGQDEMGRFMRDRPTSDGRLYGQVSSKQGLPMYKIHVNFNGQHLIRTAFAGNPNTRDGMNNLKRNAQAVRAGQRVILVYEADDAIKAANPGTALKSKCTNGQWEIING